MTKRNLFYAQSGGVTAVINATACGVIQAAQKSDEIDRIYVGRNGILGAINQDLIDVTDLPDDAVQSLFHTPSSAFGTCRYKLKDGAEGQADYQCILNTLSAHNIGHFFYNGGNDSQHNTHVVSQLCKAQGIDVNCIGLPKTIDNDLADTDCCPGFGSVAKYVAVSTLEAALDVRAMSATSTKVFIMEVMGRHAGWVAASAALASVNGFSAPHAILLPEKAIDKAAFLALVQSAVDTHGFCVVVASEGIKDASTNKRIGEGDRRDAFGHVQLGGVAPTLAGWVESELDQKTHWAVADYLQRSARHIASQVDVEQAYAIGQQGVERSLSGVTDVMLTIDRVSQTPYEWAIGQTPLERVANHEKPMPDDYIAGNGMHVTEACLDYLRPLIQGESYPPYKDGVPQYGFVDLSALANATVSQSEE